MKHLPCTGAPMPRSIGSIMRPVRHQPSMDTNLNCVAFSPVAFFSCPARVSVEHAAEAYTSLGVRALPVLLSWAATEKVNIFPSSVRIRKAVLASRTYADRYSGQGHPCFAAHHYLYGPSKPFKLFLTTVSSLVAGRCDLCVRVHWKSLVCFSMVLSWLSHTSGRIVLFCRAP